MAIDIRAMFEKYIRAMFEKYGGEDADPNEYLEFERVTDRLCNIPDLNAFLLLDKLVPDDRGRDMISGADHDVIWLRTDIEKLAEVATEADILTLVRCGVMYDNECDCLSMFA